MKHINDSKSDNIIKVPIISETFYRTGENGYTIKCKLIIYNPFIGSKQRFVGVAKCHPDDALSLKHGRHIAESRAKAQMYRRVQQDTCNTLTAIIGKYYNLEQRELEHIKELVHESL